MLYGYAIWDSLYGDPNYFRGNDAGGQAREEGMIVIPSEVRKVLGLKEGAVLIMEAKEGRILLTPKRRISVDDLFGAAGIGEVELEDVEGGLAGEEIR